MNVLEVIIIVGSIIGSALFFGGILWAIFISIPTGFNLVGYGSAVVIITVLTALC